jgi:hypothetical protein
MTPGSPEQDEQIPSPGIRLTIIDFCKWILEDLDLDAELQKKAATRLPHSKNKFKVQNG